MRMRTYSGLAACAAALAMLTVSPAFGGEVTGNGKDTQGPAHANSICAFSGLNDNPVNPPPGDFPGKIQNFAHFLKFLSELMGFRVGPQDAPTSPSESCNPNAGGGE